MTPKQGVSFPTKSLFGSGGMFFFDFDFDFFAPDVHLIRRFEAGAYVDSSSFFSRCSKPSVTMCQNPKPTKSKYYCFHFCKSAES